MPTPAPRKPLGSNSLRQPMPSPGPGVSTKPSLQLLFADSISSKPVAFGSSSIEVATRQRQCICLNLTLALRSTDLLGRQNSIRTSNIERLPLNCQLSNANPCFPEFGYRGGIQKFGKRVSPSILIPSKPLLTSHTSLVEGVIH